MQKIWELAGKYSRKTEPNVDEGWQNLKARIEMDKQTTLAKPRVRFVQLALRVAAMLLLLLGMAFLGRSFFDNQGLLSKSAGPGEKTSVTLPDGSLVWLNEDSKITYPKDFSGSSRTIQLSGEAFFDVQPDANRPFLVKTAQLEVEVLGTAFNVRDYTGEAESEVRVRHGKVKMKPLISSKFLILEKSQRGTFHTGEKSLVKDAVVDLNAGGWINQSLVFKNSRMAAILDEVSKVYGVSIDWKNAPIRDCLFQTDLSRESLADVFKTFEVAFNCQIQEKAPNQYIVLGGACQ